MPDKDRKFLCKVEKCPMENSSMDEKVDHNNSLRRVFGDDFRVINCEKVKTESGKVICCEMMIRTTLNPVTSLLPDGFSILMEVE